jgi:DNA-directed RNA polymerase specialized sigma24 family protein
MAIEAYRLAVRITGNVQDAEEVVQDAFWSVVRKIDTFRATRPWDLGSTGSSATLPTRSCANVHTYSSRSHRRTAAPFDEDGRHAGALTDWSARLDDPAVKPSLRAVLSSAVSEASRLTIGP